MKFFKHDVHEDAEEIDEETNEEFIHNTVELNHVLDKLKLENKEEYLEAWRKDYLERLNKIIDWALHNPKNYSDVVSILFKFEEFFTQIMMLVGQAEALKRAYKDIQKRSTATKGQHPEIG